MQIMTVTAAPSTESFGYAIAARVRKYLESAGHRVIFHDLYREQFPPLLPVEEIPYGAETDPTVAAHCSELTASDGIVIVHPNWWGQPPAVLKGWVDRVFRPGTAYLYEGKPGEIGTVTGLLSGKFALVFTTGDTDEETERSYFHDPLETLWRYSIFGFCGVTRFLRHHFSVIMISTEQQRRMWLDEAETVTKNFLDQDSARKE
jgi:NAD(P)H dehydrogenase (quinone)